MKFIFSNVASVLRISGGMFELDQRYVKSLLDAMAMNHCTSMARRCWNLSIYDRTTLRHCLQNEGNHERGSRTDHSLKNKIEENRALPQKDVGDVY